MGPLRGAIAVTALSIFCDRSSYAFTACARMKLFNRAPTTGLHAETTGAAAAPAASEDHGKFMANDTCIRSCVCACCSTAVSLLHRLSSELMFVMTRDKCPSTCVAADNIRIAHNQLICLLLRIQPGRATGRLSCCTCASSAALEFMQSSHLLLCASFQGRPSWQKTPNTCVKRCQGLWRISSSKKL